jgi:hypothetical protein
MYEAVFDVTAVQLVPQESREVSLQTLNLGIIRLRL